MRKRIADLKVKKSDEPPNCFKPDVKANERYAELVRHVETHGVMVPVFVDPEGYIVTGHYRTWAALDAGLKYVPVRLLKAGTRKEQLAEALELV
jgi:ParB-like chromosome segregation protein Spo0J